MVGKFALLATEQQHYLLVTAVPTRRPLSVKVIEDRLSDPVRDSPGDWIRKEGARSGVLFLCVR